MRRLEAGDAEACHANVLLHSALGKASSVVAVTLRHSHGPRRRALGRELVSPLRRSGPAVLCPRHNPRDGLQHVLRPVPGQRLPRGGARMAPRHAHEAVAPAPGAGGVGRGASCGLARARHLPWGNPRPTQCQHGPHHLARRQRSELVVHGDARRSCRQGFVGREPVVGVGLHLAGAREGQGWNPRKVQPHKFDRFLGHACRMGDKLRQDVLLGHLRHHCLPWFYPG
mmetsp:Transcript_46802/g.131624  ORF Transcript_46802/g.131624 Transcript_46802/m.131624 type:complete len:227 (+) Transcript_46802:339-1019(+)